mmetsp:Transcript_82725/g.230078  ORF Transcript_82725/g.230078 Transcript_82725/m.230078 type:complete len:217 (-) Transcript_82725:266-916(-)
MLAAAVRTAARRRAGALGADQRRPRTGDAPEGQLASGVGRACGKWQVRSGRPRLHRLVAFVVLLTARLARFAAGVGVGVTRAAVALVTSSHRRAGRMVGLCGAARLCWTTHHCPQRRAALRHIVVVEIVVASPEVASWVCIGDLAERAPHGRRRRALAHVREHHRLHGAACHACRLCQRRAPRRGEHGDVGHACFHGTRDQHSGADGDVADARSSR